LGEGSWLLSCAIGNSFEKKDLLWGENKGTSNLIKSKLKAYLRKRRRKNKKGEVKQKN